MEWPTSQNVSDVIYFMGLPGYYRKFIENLSKIDFPITALQKKETKFLWNEKCEVNFKKLYILLTKRTSVKGRQHG